MGKFYTPKRLVVAIGSFSVFGFLTWLVLLPVKLIFKDKFHMGSAMAGVGILTGLTLVTAGFADNEAMISSFDDMIENM